MQRWYPRPLTGRSHNLPDSLASDPPLHRQTSLVHVRDHEQRSRGWRTNPLGRHIVAEDRSCLSWQGDRYLMTTLAHHPTQAEIKHNISHVQRCHFAPSKPPEGHESEHRPLPERTAVQERCDRGPSW